MLVAHLCPSGRVDVGAPLYHELDADTTTSVAAPFDRRVGPNRIHGVAGLATGGA
jgi:hypothetical protein